MGAINSLFLSSSKIATVNGSQFNFIINPDVICAALLIGFSNYNFKFYNPKTLCSVHCLLPFGSLTWLAW